MHANTQMPVLSGDTVLFDIDETITYRKLDAASETGGVVVDALRAAVMQVHGLNFNQALTKIRREFDPDSEDVGKHLEPLDVSPEMYWGLLMPRLKRSVGIYPDAVEAIRTLHGRGWRLYPATTNGRMACLAKLALGNLADQTGSACFDDVFGGSDVVPDGKVGPHFFRAILRRVGASPDRVIHVGDDPAHDLANALAAGITQVVLPRRDQPRDWIVEEDGGIYVRSLKSLSDMLGRPAR